MQDSFVARVARVKPNRTYTLKLLMSAASTFLFATWFPPFNSLCSCSDGVWHYYSFFLRLQFGAYYLTLFFFSTWLRDLCFSFQCTVHYQLRPWKTCTISLGFWNQGFFSALWSMPFLSQHKLLFDHLQCVNSSRVCSWGTFISLHIPYA